MSQIADAGFSYTELGPYGYYPTDPERLSKEFQSRDLSVVAGFIFQPLHEPSAEKQILEITEKTCALLSAVGACRLVVIDHISPERMQTAGNRSAAIRLDQTRFDFMVSLIGKVVSIALRYGILPVLDQHAGCYIEFEAEIERILAEFDPEELGICLDTGHMACQQHACRNLL
jgi:inosose dehydratase